MKAILVIDMPKNCFDCPCVEDEMGYCCATNDRKVCPWQSIPEWCPLKPLPKKKEMTIIKRGQYEESKYIKGYNDCISEILGGEE